MCHYESLCVSLGLEQSPLMLQHDVLTCISTSVAYLHLHAHSMLQEGILSCTQGDVHTHVSSLRELQEAPEDEQLRRVHFCAQLWPLDTCSALLLLRDSPCSICLVEKGHSSAGFVRRAHDQMGSESIRQRACITEMRPLLRSSVRDREYQRLNHSWLHKLHSSKKVRFTSQNAFASHVLSSCSSAISDSPSTRSRALQDCIRRHNHMFKELNVEQQGSLRLVAASVRMSRRQSLMDTAASDFAAMKLLEQRSQASVQSGDRFVICRTS